MHLKNPFGQLCFLQTSIHIPPLLHHVKVVEIAGMCEHLLTECEAKDSFDKCPRCTEAINKAEYDQHIAEETCPRKLAIYWVIKEFTL